uniref:Uncharacterized protein n=1 Tax=Heterosigma akashiwo TaxID=2829 RepID=A0A7S3XM92_HETAK
MGAAESFIGQDGSNPRLPGEWPRLSNEGPQWQRNLETVWERVTRDFEREKERTEDALRTWNEREREKREQWRQETLKNVEKLKADTQKNVEKLKADTQKNVDKLKSDAIKNIDNLRENLQNLITPREARDSGSKKSAAIPFSQIWERSPAHQKDGKKQLNNENVDTEKDKDVLQRLGIDPKDLSLSGQEQVLQSRGTDPLNPLREEGAFMSRSSTLDSSELVWPNGTSSPQLSSPTKPAGPKGSNGDDGLDISEYKSSEVTSSMGDCEVTEYNSPQRSTLSSLVSVSESDDDNQGTEEERVAQWHRGQMEQKEHKAGMSKRGSLSEGNSPIPAKKEPHRAEIKKNTSQEVVVGEEDGWSPSLPIEKSATIPNQNNSSISSVLGTEPVQEWFPSPPMKNVTAPSYQKSANNTSISGASGPHPETHGGADECSITGTGGVSGEHSQWIVEEA